MGTAREKAYMPKTLADTQSHEVLTITDGGTATSALAK